MTTKELLTWKLGVILSFGVTIAGVIVFWDQIKKTFNIINDNNNTVKKNINKISKLKNKDKIKRVVNKTDEIIEELPNPRWVKIGKIKELYYYPLKSGRGKELTECNFTEYGIAVCDTQCCITLRDRMFMVYNEETGKFITGRNFPTLLLVSICAVDKSKVKLEATGMSNYIFELLPKDIDNTVDCTMWWGEPVKCTDCGDGPAQWISQFLTGTNSGLRIGLALDNTNHSRNILEGPWEKFTKVYNTLTNDDVGLFADLASYMLMTESSLEELNNKLENKISALQFRPNIVVSGTEAFKEDNWEWIKIGSSVILRNVKPCSRCTMTRVNPETGKVDDKLEPLKTLRTFRQQKNQDRIFVDGKAPILGIYCGLYSIGNVKIGDDVFLHQSAISVRTTVL
ncbi:mitochondrial amidoxime-reducing component 1-like isoform X1 [Cotesia glomerata]|uniref:MOSC domain-containing protein n=1 Tax=Cotesia glomerata TaxID=32391 RepID=A0AAV7I087_COTGL|nr:mitochondrial amidoxime-reducing component 1-like isoform X1 [Cotesia glomerata]KAH0550864.1 hypothetical protein KQX54_021011 [Cotesia glomerata]